MSLDGRDLAFLERAMKLAELGRGHTRPNPVVGALVLRDGAVLGEGFHAAPGRDHAEVVAMKAAVGEDYRGRLRGATVYVTLEPCCHHGRTPPCTDALLASHVSRVVVGSRDPSSRVNGRGIERLRAAGIEVELAGGELERRLSRQNDAFRTAVTRGRPFVTYKYAMTLDGRVATSSGHSRWISGEVSRRRVHQMRMEADAVLVGTGTLRQDDPRLDVREVATDTQPLRVVLDARLEISPEAAIVRTASQSPVLILTGEKVAAERVAGVRGWGVEVQTVAHGENGLLDPAAVARLLAERGVQNLLLEGGPRLAAAWWEAEQIDKVAVFVAPLMGVGREGRDPLPVAPLLNMDQALRLQDVDSETLGEDVLITGYLRDPD